VDQARNSPRADRTWEAGAERSPERFHRTLKRETALPPAGSAKAQQRRFDRFRQQYNEDRPHNALGMVVPDELHVPSTKRFVEDPPDPSYPPTWDTRRVTSSGHVTWDDMKVFVGTALRGELVGGRPIDAVRYELYFGHLLLGMVDPLRPNGVLVRTRKPKVSSISPPDTWVTPTDENA
jgi:hypothetical protein